MSRKPPEERTHRRSVHAARRDAWRSHDEAVNQRIADLHSAWEIAACADPGLPTEPPGDIPPDAVRALVGLARKVEDLSWQLG